MKQYPSNLKYKKNHKSSSAVLHLIENKTFLPIKGILLIKALENSKIKYNQLEACRRSVRRKIRKQGSIFIRLFTNISRTKKALASRMGAGKGSHSYWECDIKAGQIICEVICNNYILASLAAHEAARKLPLKVKILYQFY